MTHVDWLPGRVALTNNSGVHTPNLLVVPHCSSDEGRRTRDRMSAAIAGTGEPG
jgi:hypothetical protein